MRSAITMNLLCLMFVNCSWYVSDDSDEAKPEVKTVVQGLGRSDYIPQSDSFLSTAKLRHILFDSYHTYERPNRDKNLPTLVKLRMYISALQEVDEKRQSISFDGFLEHTWLDERLRWDPAEWHNISKIDLPQDELFRPDVHLLNSASSMTPDSIGSHTPISLDSNGTVFLDPPFQFTSICHFDFTTFPWDTQLCDVYLGSWSFCNNEIAWSFWITRKQKQPVLTWNYFWGNWGANGWLLMADKITTEQTNYQATQCQMTALRITLPLKRIAGSIQRAFVVGPMVAIAMLNLVLFCLSAEHLLLVVLSAILVQIVHGGYLMFILPPTPINGIRIVRICEVNASMSLIDLLIVVVVLELTKRPLNRGPSGWVNKLLPSWCSRLRRTYYQRFGLHLTEYSSPTTDAAVSSSNIQATEINAVGQEDNSQSVAPFNWMWLAIVMGRLGIVVNIVVYTITALSLFF